MKKKLIISLLILTLLGLSIATAFQEYYIESIKIRMTIPDTITQSGYGNYSGTVVVSQNKPIINPGIKRIVWRWLRLR